jgi:hypothetical protein
MTITPESVPLSVCWLNPRNWPVDNCPDVFMPISPASSLHVRPGLVTGGQERGGGAEGEDERGAISSSLSCSWQNSLPSTHGAGAALRARQFSDDH